MADSLMVPFLVIMVDVLVQHEPQRFLADEPKSVDANKRKTYEGHQFDATGQRTALAPDGVTTRASSSYANQIGFTGRYLDKETGLWHFRARYYSGSLGRFVGRDPMLYIDGANLYYAYFVPNYVDPSGNEVINPTIYFSPVVKEFVDHGIHRGNITNGARIKANGKVTLNCDGSGKVASFWDHEGDKARKSYYINVSKHQDQQAGDKGGPKVTNWYATRTRWQGRVLLERKFEKCPDKPNCVRPVFRLQEKAIFTGYVTEIATWTTSNLQSALAGGSVIPGLDTADFTNTRFREGDPGAIGLVFGRLPYASGGTIDITNGVTPVERENPYNFIEQYKHIVPSDCPGSPGDETEWEKIDFNDVADEHI